MQTVEEQQKEDEDWKDIDNLYKTARPQFLLVSRKLP